MLRFDPTDAWHRELGNDLHDQSFAVGLPIFPTLGIRIDY